MNVKNNPPEQGWRWHKWGPYHGNFEITEEYLYDTDIDVQYTFSTDEDSYLSSGIWYYINDGKAENMGQYATSTKVLNNVKDAFMKASTLKVSDIKELDTDTNAYDDSYYDIYRTTYKNNIVVFIQRLHFQRMSFFNKLGYYLGRELIDNAVNFFLCIHNIEMFYSDETKSIIDKITKDDWKTKIPEIEFYYSLTDKEQEQLVDYINRYNAKYSQI